MNESKLTGSIGGALVSWLAVGWSWASAHTGAIGTVVAILAGIYSIRASCETIKLRRKQQESFDGDDDREQEDID